MQTNKTGIRYKVADDKKSCVEAHEQDSEINVCVKGAYTINSIMVWRQRDI